MINLKLMSKLHGLTSNISHIDIVGFHVPYFLLLFCNAYNLIKLSSLGRHQSILPSWKQSLAWRLHNLLLADAYSKSREKSDSDLVTFYKMES
jgi:hypothetical protein